jgi:hypothetical protein
MHRSTLIVLLAGAVLIALPALPSSMSGAGSALAEKAPTTNATNLNSSRSNIYRKDATGGAKSTKKKIAKVKQPTGKSGPAGIAVSDPGSEGSKPTKSKTK